MRSDEQQVPLPVQSSNGMSYGAVLDVTVSQQPKSNANEKQEHEGLLLGLHALSLLLN
jgi:hypothetical protein